MKFLDSEPIKANSLIYIEGNEMTQKEIDTLRIIECAESNKEFCMGDDGFWYWFPTGKGGHTEFSLSVLCAELIKRNEKWNKQIEEYFETKGK